MCEMVDVHQECVAMCTQPVVPMRPSNDAPSLLSVPTERMGEAMGQRKDVWSMSCLLDSMARRRGMLGPMPHGQYVVNNACEHGETPGWTRTKRGG